jgi:hypothetical protein
MVGTEKYERATAVRDDITVSDGGGARFIISYIPVVGSSVGGVVGVTVGSSVGGVVGPCRAADMTSSEMLR